MEFEAAKISNTDQNSSRRSRKRYLVLHVFFRLLGATAAFTAAVLMGLNKQTSVFAGYAINASHDSSPAFKFLVVGNGIVGGYLVVSLPFVSNLMDGCILTLLDLMNMALLMGVTSAAAAVGYIGKHGNDKIGWAKVCPYYEKFCKRTELSVGASFLAFFCLLSICLVTSLHRRKQICSD
ncbi:CASP-like protein 1F1 [Canna indica]|uniref:CASP-like protein n=1 Tax=Canna indica TaxID=4628 RepID=A0AAQ3QLP5_9LILI|nr:CASP-like protein 1F1 [Canna indica]